MMHRTINLLALILVTSFLVTGAFAQSQEPEAPTDDEVNRVAKQMYCPVCENIPLDVCPTQACAEWRDLIRLKLSEGWSDKLIKQYFAEQYGDRVLAEPPARGLNWLVYILPPLAILAGAFILFKAFQSWRRPVMESPASPGDPASAAEENDAYLRRFEAELKKREDQE